MTKCTMRYEDGQGDFATVVKDNPSWVATKYLGLKHWVSKKDRLVRKLGGPFVGTFPGLYNHALTKGV
jgi:hypothetical protein